MVIPTPVKVSELDFNSPSTRRFQEFVKEKTAIEIRVLTGDGVIGRIAWQDADWLCVLDDRDRSTLVNRSAIAFIRPV
jgi:host factor-I protein